MNKQTFIEIWREQSRFLAFLFVFGVLGTAVLYTINSDYWVTIFYFTLLPVVMFVALTVICGIWVGVAQVQQKYIGFELQTFVENNIQTTIYAIIALLVIIQVFVTYMGLELSKGSLVTQFAGTTATINLAYIIVPLLLIQTSLVISVIVSLLSST